MIVRRLDTMAPDAALRTEWLLTNGLGGFAMGTMLGANTRRYHGLLVAAARPPVARVLVLHSMMESIEFDGRVIELGTQCFGRKLLRHPDGHRHLVEFRLETPHRCRWTTLADGITVRRTVTLDAGANRVRVEYVVDGLPMPGTIRARPFLPLRDFHSIARESGGAPEAHASSDEHVEVVRGEHHARLTVPPGSWRAEPEWWRDFAYAVDRDRGQEWIEDVPSPGHVAVALAAATRTVVTIDVELVGATFGGTSAVGAESPAREALSLAAGQFVTSRVTGDRVSSTIVAGYPWFTDWGRDAMIALPGLLLVPGRLVEARSVLETFAGAIRDGVIPNCFDDAGGEPLYNTADAALWFVHAVREYARTSGPPVSGPLVAACRAIVRAYRDGAVERVRLGSDGLLVIEDGILPLTWMDARRGGVTFTPRVGRVVEINALWHNALLALAELLADVPAARDEIGTLVAWAGETARSIQAAFWWPERQCLHDVLTEGRDGNDGDESRGGDGRLRPNQILAVSLPHSPLEPWQQHGIVAVIRDRLLTPYGLRTLDRDHPDYVARYAGDLMQRDAAYHNGTVWPWLIGPYAEAVLRVGGFSEEAKQEARHVLGPLIGELETGCLGQLAEVYDGDPPHRPSGCPAQAWSVAEVWRLTTLAK